MFVRFSITLALSCLYCWYTKVPDFPFGPRGIRWLLVLRGFWGTVGVSGFYCKFRLFLISIFASSDESLTYDKHNRLPRISFCRRSHSYQLHLPYSHCLRLLHLPTCAVRQKATCRRCNLFLRRRLDCPAWPAVQAPRQPCQH